MRLFWVLVFFSSNLLSAASVAVITENNASYSTSCSAGTTTLSPCPPGIPGVSGGIEGPDYSAGADAGPSSLEPPTAIPGASTVSVSADAGAQYSCPGNFNPPCPPFIPLQASANATDTISGYTEGPSRLGLIHYSAVAIATNDFLAGLLITDGTYVYPVSFENAGCCEASTDGYLSVRLGVPFEVSAMVFAGSGFSSCPGAYPITFCAGNASEGVMSFVFLEADGSAIPFGSATVPEPGPWALCTLGLLFAIPRVRRTRR